MTPFPASMFVIVTLASLMWTTASFALTDRVFLLAVSAVLILSTSAAIIFLPTTWYNRISYSFGMSAKSPSTVPAGNLAKASSVGAKTVNGPSDFRVSTRLAAFAAANSVLN